ncbi:hypothetical protein [Paraburkholderia podalyriae]|uniref:hypothetical protein n=1 Tax=Paraburkholderia TaxID=1822464 RepID=UPI001FE3A3DC|nr:hypothetical protein [Paraburkholderia podalyriae]
MLFSRDFRSLKDAWAFRLAFWWRGVGAQLTSGESDEVQHALNAARDDFLRWAEPESWAASNPDMHDLRRMLSWLHRGSYVVHKMNDQQVKRAVYQEVARGKLLFLPPREEVQRYIEEARKQRRGAATNRPAQRDELADVANGAQSVQVSSAVDAEMEPVIAAQGGADMYFERETSAMPLGDAQPFVYAPDPADGDVMELTARGVRMTSNEPGGFRTNPNGLDVDYFDADGDLCAQYHGSHGEPHGHNFVDGKRDNAHLPMSRIDCR